MAEKVEQFTDYEIQDQYLKIKKLYGEERIKELNEYGERSYAVKIIIEAKKRGLI